MNTPSNTGEDTSWIQPCPIHGPYVDLKCAQCRPWIKPITPPTQSQEGETPETDAIGIDHLKATETEYKLRKLARSLERRLTAAQRENDRLRSEVAGLKADKDRLDWLLGVVHREGIIGLTNFLWSMIDDDPAREPDEEPEDDPERLSPTLDRAAIDAARAATEEKK